MRVSVESLRSTVVVVLSVLVLCAAACGTTPEPTDERDGPEAAHPAVQQPDDRQQAIDEQLAELAEQVTDQDLEVFARGVQAFDERNAQLREEGRDLETRQQEADSPRELRAAEQEVREEYEDALAQEGLRFDDFLMMGQVIRYSPELKERLGDYLDDDEIEQFFGPE